MIEREAAGQRRIAGRATHWGALALVVGLVGCARLFPSTRGAEVPTGGAVGGAVGGAAASAGASAGASAPPARVAGNGGVPTASAAGASSQGAGGRSTGVGAATTKDSAIVTASMIASEAKQVFGDAVAPRTDGPAEPTWDMDVRSYETHARVEHFVGVFSGRAKEPFAKALKRQTRYGALIGGALREGGLPEDLTYLALIESWYDTHAYSTAAAVGMWQFMAGTARGVGMRVDWWVDDRRDPVRSTQGAVRYLSGLRAQFGSLYLAAAAYNGGDGRVSRGLALYASDLNGVTGEDRFFTLSDTKYLRPQTRDYVPKIIAAALVGKQPARYGVVVESLPPLAFDTVRVPGATPLAAVANATNATVAMMNELNPHLIRGVTPPGDSFLVRVPAGTGASFADHFSALEPAELRAWVKVETKKGETMTSVARKHGLTAKQLGWYNPKAARLKSGNLAAGQVMLIPTSATVSAALNVPDPSIERYPRRAKAGAAKKGAAAKGSVAAKGGAAKKPVASSASAKAKKSTPSAKSAPTKKSTSSSTPAPRKQAAPAKNGAPLKKPAPTH